MADFALLIDSARLILCDWLKAFTANPEHWVASTVLVSFIFITWLWPPLRRRIWIRIKIGDKDRRPGVQRYLAEDIDNHIDSVKRSGIAWSAFWTAVAFATCESYAVTLSLSAIQQSNVLRDSSATAFFALGMAFATSPFALVVGNVVWISTEWLWMRTPLWIEEERKLWFELRKDVLEKGKGFFYYKGYDGGKEWAWWELEDKELLTERKGAPTTPDKRSAWEMLEDTPLEMSFWEILKENRVPHIYQLGVPTPDGVEDHRYLDFALLDPKSGEPVLGIETDERHHFGDKRAAEDFIREQEIMKASGILIHRIPGAYWLRGLHPDNMHPEDMNHLEKIKKDQQRLLDAALRERDRIIKEKRKQAQRRWPIRLLCRQQ